MKQFKTFIHHRHPSSGSVHSTLVNTKLWVCHGVRPDDLTGDETARLHRPELQGLTQGPEKQPVLQDLCPSTTSTKMIQDVQKRIFQRVVEQGILTEMYKGVICVGPSNSIHLPVMILVSSQG